MPNSNLKHASDPVAPVPVGEPGEISPGTLAEAMIRAGFTRQEVLDLGPGIHLSIEKTGGAQARRHGEIFALFLYKEGKLYVTSATSGTFVLDA